MKKEIEKMEILKEYKDVLTFKELKTILKVGRNTCYRLLQTGIIPSIRIGSNYRIAKVDVINYLQNFS